MKTNDSNLSLSTGKCLRPMARFSPRDFKPLQLKKASISLWRAILIAFLEIPRKCPICESVGRTVKPQNKKAFMKNRKNYVMTSPATDKPKEFATNSFIQLRTAILPFLLAFMLSCFALSPKVLAVVPAPDGGYPDGNTAEGDNALLTLTTGASNTAIGFDALLSNTTGDFNTAIGFAALGSNTTGASNTAEGSGALLLNTTGSSNTANGNNALFHNTTGFQNVATGVQALFSNTTGFHNAAAGFQALLSNTTGNHNTADGDNALVHNTTGTLNTAVGGHALDQNITGSSNVALGFQAGFNITGNGNVCIGQNILGLAGESNVTRIGNIGSTAQANGVFVTVGAGGKLGFQVSSRRYKDDIKPMDRASEALFALKPVSFRYKREMIRRARLILALSPKTWPS